MTRARPFVRALWRARLTRRSELKHANSGHFEGSRLERQMLPRRTEAWVMTLESFRRNAPFIGVMFAILLAIAGLLIGVVLMMTPR